MIGIYHPLIEFLYGILYVKYVPFTVAFPYIKLYPAIVIPYFDYNDGAYIFKHVKSPVNWDNTVTVPFKFTFVSLFINNTLNLSPVVKPYTLIFDDNLAFWLGINILG